QPFVSHTLSIVKSAKCSPKGPKKNAQPLSTPCRVPHPRRAQRGRVVVSRVKTRESFWQVAHISQFPAYLEYVCSVFLVVIPAGDLLLSLGGDPHLNSSNMGALF